MARVRLLGKDEVSPEVKEIFQKIEDNGARVINLFKAVANSPKVVPHFVRLGNSIVGRMELYPKWRELVILRVARLTGSEYEWMAHTSVALETGVSQEQINTIGDWKDSSAFNDEERAILEYADEITRNVSVTDQTFSRLRKFCDEQTIVELTLTAGYYGMLARVLVPLQVEVDEVPIGSVNELAGRRNQPQ
ncbi:carboxymuconolactone decarboxylase family protein [Chloroflexota bacterium]